MASVDFNVSQSRDSWDDPLEEDWRTPTYSFGLSSALGANVGVTIFPTLVKRKSVSRNVYALRISLINLRYTEGVLAGLAHLSYFVGMDEPLHVLNGDATLEVFRQSGVPGVTMVWRDALVDGPVMPAIDQDGFWQLRAQFMEEAYQVPANEYLFKTQEELNGVLPLDYYPEVVLWFEYDWFCQVNMVAAIAWLTSQQPRPQKLSLVMVGDHPAHDHRVGLGELAPGSYQALFRQRKALSLDELSFARRVWAAYCDTAPFHLWMLQDGVPQVFQPYMAEGIRGHAQRFPSVANGLNRQQQRLLELVAQGLPNIRKVVGTALRDRDIYGFGDLQLFNMLDDLKPLIGQEEPTALSPLGQAVLEGQENWLNHYKGPVMLGGTHARRFRWDETAGKLVSSV